MTATGHRPRPSAFPRTVLTHVGRSPCPQRGTKSHPRGAQSRPESPLPAPCRPLPVLARVDSPELPTPRGIFRCLACVPPQLAVASRGFAEARPVPAQHRLHPGARIFLGAREKGAGDFEVRRRSRPELRFEGDSSALSGVDGVISRCSFAEPWQSPNRMGSFGVARARRGTSRARGYRGVGYFCAGGLDLWSASNRIWDMSRLGKLPRRITSPPRPGRDRALREDAPGSRLWTFRGAHRGRSPTANVKVADRKGNGPDFQNFRGTCQEPISPVHNMFDQAWFVGDSASPNGKCEGGDSFSGNAPVSVGEAGLKRTMHHA
jgi:hypothetical protein